MMKSTYTPWIQPGVTPVFYDDFWALSLVNARAFAREVEARAGERISELEKLVQSTRGFGPWRADLTAVSAEGLGRFVAKKLPRRPATADDTTWSFGPLPPGVSADRIVELDAEDDPGVVLTELGESIAADVGIYLGEIIRLVHHCFRWSVCRRKTARSISAMHHQPIVSWLGMETDGFYGPFNVGRNVCLRIVEGNRPDTALREVVENWGRTERLIRVYGISEPKPRHSRG